MLAIDKTEGKTVKHAFSRPGRFKVTLQVEDDSNSLCSQGKADTMVWVNTPPVPRLNLPTIGAVDEEITLDGYGSVDSDGEILRYLSTSPHFEALVKGLVDTADLGYFVVMIGTFLVLTKAAVESARWR